MECVVIVVVVSDSIPLRSPFFLWGVEQTDKVQKRLVVSMLVTSFLVDSCIGVVWVVDSCSSSSPLPCSRGFP